MISVVQGNSPSVIPEEASEETPADREALRTAARRALTNRIRARREAKVRAIARARAPLARERFSEFVRQAWPINHPEPLEWNWHLDVICDHVQALAGYLHLARDRHQRGISWEMPAQNLLINIPPRMGKTELVGVYLPCWLWLKDPSLHLRYITGNEKMRTISSRSARDLLASEWYRESFKVGWQIRGDADAIGMFDNTAHGRMLWSTYEQKITGEGTDIMIIDDPIDAKESPSEVVRENVNQAWDLAIESRVKHAPRCLRIGIMQRLHENDWSNHVLEKGNWRHVCIPMEHEEPSCPCRDCKAGESFLGRYDHRSPGESLHPARWPASIVDAFKREAMKWAGQYQQRPAPLEGGTFKRECWGTYDPNDLPDFRRVYIFMDCSAKKTPTGSRTAIVVIGEVKGGRRRYVLDVLARPMDITDMKRVLVGEERMKNVRAPYGRGTFLERWALGGRAPKLVVEDKAAGIDLIIELKAVGINVVGWDPKNSSKESRAHSVEGIVTAGDVLLPSAAPWKDSFLHEVSLFPNGRWDDQVDALTMGLCYLRDNSTLIKTHM